MLKKNKLKDKKLVVLWRRMKKKKLVEDFDYYVIIIWC